MATTFVEVTPEDADQLWEPGLLWSRFLSHPWRPDKPPLDRPEWWCGPSSWGTNWKFAIQVEE